MALPLSRAPAALQLSRNEPCVAELRLCRHSSSTIRGWQAPRWEAPCRTSTQLSLGLRSRSVAVASTSGQTPAEDEQEARYEALVAELAPLSPQELRMAAVQRPEELLDSRFLFWLRDRERGGGSGAAGAGAAGRRAMPAAEREALARLGQELTTMREWEEDRSARTLLPSLAASLAYSNLQRWKEETGEAAPQVVAGVDLEQLYRLGEEEERKLRASMDSGGGGSGPRKQQTRSSIEEFTKHNKAYAELAAGAMARVRARLSGFDDDGPRAAEAVLGALLRHMGSAEERATYLPDAFAPPGLDVTPPSGAGAAKPALVVTTPDLLIQAARARLDAVRSARETASAAGAQGQGAQGGQQQEPGIKPLPWKKAAAAAAASAPGAGTGAAAPGGGAAPAAAERPAGRLPSGEDEEAALVQLLEIIDEYDRNVFQRKTPLERMGHRGWP